jgi:probable HAF family extracellular repeat protein
VTQGAACGNGGTCNASGQCENDGCAFVPLGDLPGGQFNSAAFAVSDDGVTVTGRTHVGTAVYRAFRWKAATGMIGLSSGSTSSGRGISSDGSKIVGIGGSEITYSSQFAFRERGTFIETTSTSTVAKAVSASGLVAVGDRNLEAFRWVEGSSPQSLFLGTSTANSVSADGNTIVGRGHVPGRSSIGEAFVWTSAGVIGLGDLVGTGTLSSEATGISPDGQRVVGIARGPNNVTHGFVYTESTGMQSIGANFTPAAVTNSGVVVGSALGAYIKGSRLGDGLVRSLLIGCGINLTNWSLSEANDVTPDGRIIVGTALNPSGNFEAYWARL